MLVKTDDGKRKMSNVKPYDYKLIIQPWPDHQRVTELCYCCVISAAGLTDDG